MLGGIYRRVFLQTYHPVHFDFEPYASTPVLVQTPVVSEESAQVKLSCRIKNDADKNSKLSLVFALLDKEGKVVSRKKMKVKVDVGQSLPKPVVTPHPKSYCCQPLLQEYFFHQIYNAQLCPQ